MADPQRAAPQRRFRVRAGVQRKTAEERAASIQAEALRQADQTQTQPQPPPFQAPANPGRRPGPVARDPRIRSQNTGSVFGSTGAVVGSRAKSSHAVGGTEELVQRAEGDDDVVAGDGKVGVKVEGQVLPGSTTAKKKADGRAGKTTTNKDDVMSLSEDEFEGAEGKPIDIDDIDRISISSGPEDEKKAEDDDDAIVVSGRRHVKKPSRKPVLGLRPVRAARDVLVKRDDDRGRANVEAGGGEVKGRKRDKADPDHARNKMDLDEEDGEDDGAATVPQMTTGAEDQHQAVLPPGGPVKKRKNSTGTRMPTTKDTKPHLETIEEGAERERHASELRKLKDELSTLTAGDHPHKDQAQVSPPQPAPPYPQHGRLYLFQFPPLTPMLINSSHEKEVRVEPQIKREEGGEGGGGGMETQGETTTEAEKPKLLTATNTSALTAGLAGKLNVHRSGKVTLEWGVAGCGGDVDDGGEPTNLEVRWGSEVDFLQDVVLTSGSREHGSGQEKKAWALGQVRNKFVVVPDWGKIYD